MTVTATDFRNVATRRKAKKRFEFQATIAMALLNQSLNDSRPEYVAESVLHADIAWELARIEWEKVG